MQYFLTYVLGLPAPSGKKAEIGTIVHKVLECLANGKLSYQKDDFAYIDKICGEIAVHPDDWGNASYINHLVRQSYTYYQSKSIHRWYPRDEKKIVAAEPFFDFQLEEDWAHYEWVLPDGRKIEGQLGIKGTVDLILDAGNGVYEVNDWKTGQRRDWATDEEKDYDKLNQDPQLSIYHLALSRMYPEIKHWAMTMNYIDAGGPFTCSYTESDKERTLKMLQKQFERIKRCIRPTLRKGKNRWFCARVCHYGRNVHKDSKCEDSICWHISQKIRRIGIQNTIKEEINPNFTIGTYQSPGE